MIATIAMWYCIFTKKYRTLALLFFITFSTMFSMGFILGAHSDQIQPGIGFIADNAIVEAKQNLYQSIYNSTVHQEKTLFNRWLVDALIDISALTIDFYRIFMIIFLLLGSALGSAVFYIVGERIFWIIAQALTYGLLGLSIVAVLLCLIDFLKPSILDNFVKKCQTKLQV